MRMKLGLDPHLVEKWREREGLDVPAAALEIKKCLGCSDSKAEKIASGRYVSRPSLLERVALASRMRIEETALFPVTAGKSEAS